MADPVSKRLIKDFLTKNFKSLFSDNELGALGNIATESQIKDELGS